MLSEYKTTRDIVIPAGTRAIHLDGKLVFGAFEFASKCQGGFSMGIDAATETGVIEAYDASE